MAFRQYQTKRKFANPVIARSEETWQSRFSTPDRRVGRLRSPPRDDMDGSHPLFSLASFHYEKIPQIRERAEEISISILPLAP
jgi:hypothetical protein